MNIPTPHSIPTLAKKRSSANNLSLNPSNCINHRKNREFSSSKNLETTAPGILPARIAAAKSCGKLSTDRFASAKTIIASSLFLSSALSPSPLWLLLSLLSPPPPPEGGGWLMPPYPPPEEVAMKRGRRWSLWWWRWRGEEGKGEGRERRRWRW